MTLPVSWQRWRFCSKRIDASGTVLLDRAAVDQAMTS